MPGVNPNILNQNEQRHFTEWNATRTEYPRVCLHELIAKQANLSPAATALAFRNERLTYRELNRRSNQLARYIQKLGVGPDVLVGICLERSVNMMVALLAILKAGGAYVPLDPEYPAERLEHMVSNSGMNILLTEETLRSQLSSLPANLICIDSLRGSLSREGAENPASNVTPDNLAYVIYTSGSTGKPKGVQIPHRAVVNFLWAMQDRPGLSSKDVLVAVTTISFDIAGLELYLPLIVGAQVTLASREIVVDGERLKDLLATGGVTCMQATPATWRLLLEAGWTGDKNLKILIGGEAVPRDLVNQLQDKCSSIWNMYGPTETTIWSTIHEIRSSEGPVSIGKPIANTQIYILDNELQFTPIGDPGELYIGGAGLARGYLNRPELTAERFIANPFRGKTTNTAAGPRIYRTGDLARWHSDGNIECLGRVDHQVKIRGFRIELGEIETLIDEHSGISQNVVVARENIDGEKLLVAYLIANRNPGPSIPELRAFLKNKLPDYMIPSRFVFLEAFPLTPNRKVDRKALPMPAQLEVAEKRDYVKPGNSTEIKLTKIWEAVLHLRPVGLKDDFFELGGHSLLAAKLIRRIEQSFGKKLSIVTVFQAPTIEMQALLLRDGSATAVRWPSGVVPVQPGGSNPPFFCFGYGAGPVFLPLARRLGPDQPVLGIDPTLLDAAPLPASCEMEDVVAHIAKQIRALQPDGPYYLGGVCGGGLLAYATAGQLLKEGQQVALLALFEPHTSWHDKYVSHSSGSGLGWAGTRLKFHLSSLGQLKSKDKRAYIHDHFRERSRVLVGTLKRRFASRLKGARSNGVSSHSENIQNLLGPAYQSYRTEPIASSAVLFQATRREPGGEWELQYWKDLVDRLDVHDIPGYSNWLVRFFAEPAVDILANHLRNYLPSEPRSSRRVDQRQVKA